MKWLKSTTQKAYQYNGKTIPPCVTKNNAFLGVTNDEFNEMNKSAVIKALIGAGAIMVTDVEPSTPTQQVSSLTKEKADLIRKNTELEEKLKALDNAVAKSEFDTLQVKYNDLEKEAKDKIAVLTAELNKLKATAATKKE